MDATGSAAAILIGRLVVITGLNYGFSVALAWVLPTAEFAQVAVLQAVLLVSAMALNSGFPWVLAWTSANRERLGSAMVARVFRTSVAGNLVFGSVLGVFVFLGLPGLVAVGGGDGNQRLLAVAALTLPLFALSSVGRGALQGNARFGRMASVQLAEVVVKVGVTLCLVEAAGLGSDAVALGFLLGAGAATVLAAWFLRDVLPRGRLDWAPLSTYLSALPLFGATFGFALLMTLDILSLSAAAGTAGVTAAVVATYQVGAMIARLPYFMGDALVDAIFPYMARHHDSVELSHGYFKTAVRRVLILILPVQVMLIVSPQPLVRLAFPHAYAGAADLIRLLALGAVGALAMTMFGKALQALGRRRAALIGVACGLGAEIVLLATLIPRLGADGAAIAYVTGAWTGAILLARSYLRAQRLTLPRLRALRRPVRGLAVVLPFCLLAVRLPPRAGLLCLGVGLVAYGAALWRFDAAFAFDLRSLPTVTRITTRGRHHR
jgi:O-antigen/teichoic acid export membrane protein